MKSAKLLCILMIVMAGVVLINISVTFIKIVYFERELTGYASGFVNLSIMTTLSMNVSRDTINWSEGMINSGEMNATLYTSGEAAGVSRGNWSSSNVKGLIIANLGSVNASIFLLSGKNAHDFFNSSSSSNEEYKWNVTNKESGSCSGGTTLGQWQDVNKTSGGTKFCSQLDFHSNNNELYLDILLTVPYDSRNVGEQSDTITVTANAAG